MKKTRKFISIFAILFAIVLALSVCFFAACKGGSDDGGNSGDTGTQQGDDTGSGSGDGSGSGSGTDGSGSGSGTEDGSESDAGQTVTQVVYLATSADKQYTTAGDAVFTNESDLKIAMSSDGLTYTVSGTASVMGEAEAEWYATDDVEEGTPYVVIKIAVAEGESIYFENSGKTYTNDEEGAANFDDGYIFIVCKLSFEGDNCVTETKYDITPVEGESVTYTVSFSGVKYPAEETPVTYTQSHTIDFNDGSTYAFITTAEGTDENGVTGQYATAGTHTSGILSLVIVDANKTGIRTATLNGESVGVLVTGGRSTSTKLYFQINPAAYAGENLKIEVKMSGSEEAGSSLFVATKAMDVQNATTSTDNVLDGVTSTGIEDVQTLTYETVTSSSSLYLLVSANTTIFSITISLTGEVDPWANEGTSNPSDDTQQSTGSGLSFFVPNAENGVATSGSFAANAEVVSNEAFKLTTTDGLTYSVGAQSNNNTMSNVSFTDQSGESHTPGQGLRSGTVMTPVVSTTGEGDDTQTTTTAASIADILEVTALQDATVYVYLTLSNNSYSVNPSGTIDYTINNDSTQNVSVSSRTSVAVLALNLSAGDIVKIGATHSTLNSAGTTAQSLYLWLFGAEAVLRSAE